MVEFFKQRSTQHMNRMLRYMRYVFNDHFVLVCLFLLGGVGFYYSGLIRTLPKDFFWGKIIIVVVLLFSLPIGKVATLLQEADLVFLLPKEKEINGYLKYALQRSLILPFAFLTVITGFFMPLLVVSTSGQFIDFVYYLFVMLIAKGIWLKIECNGLYQGMQKKAREMKICLLLTMCILLFAMTFVTPFLFFLVFVNFLWLSPLKEKGTFALLDWDRAIHVENQRLHRVYKFISLFTDVPEITSVVKRRKYFDLFLKPITSKHKNTYLYLYLRAFLRGSEYFGLVARLSAIGFLILLFTKQEFLSLAVGVLFMYLIAFQLLPLYSQFDYMILTHLYPVKEKDRQSNFLGLMMIVMCIVFIVFVLGVLTSGAATLLVIGLYILATILLALPYTMLRLKKIEKRK
ncbi:ABC-2 type transport system permease protein [Pilibacter termitis]|uniref:ABC-2 type transport system permease protein n=1 Tax=Pilibacter termitis TaxID=263852 RepID=A0A1T4LDW6_9ENTE|nr:ABC transporter permease [Pilibacter termitis]SJZ52767.1 ABC-2 type transport system permease protein [Pilibacter termitis]